MSSLNEKGRKLVTHKLNALNTGFIHTYIAYSRQHHIPSKVIETCCIYTDPFILWIATRVFVRFCSPNNDNDQSKQSKNKNPKISISDCKALTVTNTDSENAQFEYDYIYNSTSTIKDIFERTGKPLIDELLNGYNTAFIAHGPNASGAHSLLFGEYNHSPFDISAKNPNECLIGDDGMYQHCLKYLFEQLKNKNYEMRLQHIYTYPEMQILGDALVNKYIEKKGKTELEIRLKNGEIHIENVRSLHVNTYNEIKHLYQCAHNNIYSSQLSYAEIEFNEAKSNYFEYKNSINQIISIHLKQYVRNGILYESNVKFIIPKYYFGNKEMATNTLTDRNCQKSDWNNMNSYKSDPLFTVCSALSKDLMANYKDCYFTYLCKDVFGGNCKTLFLMNCSVANKYVLETIKCLKFGKLLRLIYNNPKKNICSIREWEEKYNKLQCKYDELISYKQSNEKERKSRISILEKEKKEKNKKKLKEIKFHGKRQKEYRNEMRVIKQGYLNKEGGIIKNIKVRYFILFEDRKLFYFDDVTSKQAIGVIDVKKDCENIEIVNWLKAENDTHNLYGFILTTKQRKWKLGTGSINEVNEWCKVLKKASQTK